MPWIDVLGYAASACVLATFCMRAMIPLRVAAILSNVLFALFGALAHIHPVLLLHVVLLPVNIARLHQALAPEPATSFFLSSIRNARWITRVSSVANRLPFLKAVWPSRLIRPVASRALRALHEAQRLRSGRELPRQLQLLNPARDSFPFHRRTRASDLAAKFSHQGNTAMDIPGRSRMPSGDPARSEGSGVLQMVNAVRSRMLHR